MSYLPIEILELFKDQFSFPDKPLFGSVATVQNGYPRIRTMRIYEFNQEGCPVLLTHTGSNKWSQFVQQPLVSINIVSDSKLLQVTLSGQLILHTAQSTYESNRYWNLVRADVKKIYDPKHKVGEPYRDLDSLTVSEEPLHTFGIAYVVPTFWETLHLENDYPKSHRYQFHMKEGSWQKQRVHVG